LSVNDKSLIDQNEVKDCQTVQVLLCETEVLHCYTESIKDAECFFSLLMVLFKCISYTATTGGIWTRSADHSTMIQDMESCHKWVAKI